VFHHSNRRYARSTHPATMKRDPPGDWHLADGMDDIVVAVVTFLASLKSVQRSASLIVLDIEALYLSMVLLPMV